MDDRFQFLRPMGVALLEEARASAGQESPRRTAGD
jgi:hypothetical protein